MTSRTVPIDEYLSDEYLSAEVNFGGELMPRGRAIREMQKDGANPQQIDAWLMGNDLRRSIDAQQVGVNTRICYSYRDGSNCKQEYCVTVRGQLAFESLQPYLDEGRYFAPEDVGLFHPGELFGSDDFPHAEVDHAFCELYPEDVYPNALRENGEEPLLIAGELLRRFYEASLAGWPAQRNPKYRMGGLK